MEAPQGQAPGHLRDQGPDHQTRGAAAEQGPRGIPILLVLFFHTCLPPTGLQLRVRAWQGRVAATSTATTGMMVICIY
jgi:hypothetical protein